MSKAEYPTKHPNLGWAKAMVKRRQRARCIQAAVYIYICDIYIYTRCSHFYMSFEFLLAVILEVILSKLSTSYCIRFTQFVRRYTNTHTELSISTCIGQHIGPVVGFLTSGAVIPFGPSPQVLFLGLLHLPSPLTQQTSMLQNDKWICSATLQPPKNS